jgi:hypothetical protein
MEPYDSKFEIEIPRYSNAWFQMLYSELGKGLGCYRSTQLYDGIADDGALRGCKCCHEGVKLNLLPKEEIMFEALLNDFDFRLVNHQFLEGRKAIICSKMGLCDGKAPYVCRMHPIYFTKGLFIFEEGLCRLLASTFISLHRPQIERVRQVVVKYQLEEEVLGYGRKIGDDYLEFEH